MNEQLNDVTVLSTGEVRVVWAANDGLLGDYNVYGSTFTVAGSSVTPPPTNNPCEDDDDDDHDGHHNRGHHSGDHRGDHNGDGHCDNGWHNKPHQHGEQHRGDDDDGDGHSHEDLSAGPQPATGCSSAGDLAPFMLVLVALWLSMPKPARARNSRRS